MDQNKLKRKFVQGNKKAFGIVYDKYCDAMFNVCLRYTRNHDEAADILQDAFLRVYQKRQLFNLEYELGAWIKRIVIHEAINHFRAKKMQFVDEGEPHFVEEVEIAVDFEEEKLDFKDLILDILREMPDGYKTIFNLYVFENLKHQEIAEYLNVSVSTSKTQLFKARKMIQAKLEELKITRERIING